MKKIPQKNLLYLTLTLFIFLNLIFSGCFQNNDVTGNNNSSDDDLGSDGSDVGETDNSSDDDLGSDGSDVGETDNSSDDDLGSDGSDVEDSNTNSNQNEDDITTDNDSNSEDNQYLQENWFMGGWRMIYPVNKEEDWYFYDNDTIKIIFSYEEEGIENYTQTVNWDTYEIDDERILLPPGIWYDFIFSMDYNLLRLNFDGVKAIEMIRIYT